MKRASSSESDSGSSASSSAGKMPFNVNLTYPIPAELYKAITGIVPAADATSDLGRHTEIIHLNIEKDSDVREFFYYMFQDIFHDSQGARSGEGMRLGDFFNSLRDTGDSARGLNNFMETFLYGMNQFYGNSDSPPPPAAEIQKGVTRMHLGAVRGMKRSLSDSDAAIAPESVTRRNVDKSWVKPTISTMINTYYATETDLKFGRPNKQYNITGTNESEGLETILREVKQLYYNVDGEDIPAFHTKYPTNAVMNAAKPYLVSYDAGSDLLHSILGLFEYVDISIVNVKDPGDSMRTRNKLLSSIEKIVHQRPAVGIQRVIADLTTRVNSANMAKAANSDLYPKLLKFLDIFKSFDASRLNTETYYVHNYVSTRVLECLKDKCQMKNYEQPNFLAAIPIENLTPDAVFKDYKTYIHAKLKTIIGEEKFVVHKKNLRFRITHGEMTLMDVEYYFDEQKKMKIRFHPGQGGEHADLGQINKKENIDLYNRANLNSARDVGRNIDYYNKKLNESLATGRSVVGPIPTILGKIQAASIQPGTSIYEYLSKTTTDKGNIPYYQAISKIVYLECMYKFIGDFCQVLYSFYIGSIFASFDRSAVSMALLVMKLLMKDNETYKTFKRGAHTAAAGSEAERRKLSERIGRGLILVTSTTFHRKTVPKVTYYTDYNGALNIERGRDSTVPVASNYATYFKAMQSEIELFDAYFKPPASAAGTGTAVSPPSLPMPVRRKKPTKELTKENYEVVRKNVPVREEKKRLFKTIEEEENAKVKETILPALVCHIASCYKVEREVGEYTIYTTQMMKLPEFVKALMTQIPFPEMRPAYLYSRLHAYFTDHREKAEKAALKLKAAQPKKGAPGRQKKPEPVFPIEPWIALPTASIAPERCDGVTGMDISCPV